LMLAEATGGGAGDVEGDEESRLALLAESEEPRRGANEEACGRRLCPADRLRQLGSRRRARRHLVAGAALRRRRAAGGDRLVIAQSRLNRGRVLAPRHDVELALVGAVVPVAIEERREIEHAMGDTPEIGG